MNLRFYKGDSMESKIFKSIITALAFTTSYSMVSAQQMVPQSPSNRPPQTTSKSSIERSTKSDKKIKSDGSVRTDYRTKPNPKGKINNLNTESLNQHPVPTRANDPSRDGVRVK